MLESRTLVVACLFIGALEARAQNPQPLSVDLAISQPEFPAYMPIALSSDGKLVAYTLQYSTRLVGPKQNVGFNSKGVPQAVLGTRVWITDVQTARTFPVGDSSATSWGPAWSPDGKWLAYYSDADGAARLWVRETATGKTRRVSHVIVHAYMTMHVPRWTPDGKGLVTRVLPPGAELRLDGTDRKAGPARDSVSGMSKATVTVLRSDPAHPHGGNQMASGGRGTGAMMLADLALIDFASGRMTTLATGVSPVDYWVAPNGRFVAFTSHQPMEIVASSATSVFALGIVPLRGAAAPPRMIATRAGVADYGRSVMWSPDGSSLIYSVTDSAEREQVFAIIPDDWRPRRLGTTGLAILGDERRPGIGRSLWWSADGRSFHVLSAHSVAKVSMTDGAVKSVVRAPRDYHLIALVGGRRGGPASAPGNGSVLVAFLNDSTKQIGFARVSTDSGATANAWKILSEQDGSFGDTRSFEVDANDSRAVFLAEDSQRPRDMWTFALDFSGMRQITHTAPQLSGRRYGATELIEWRTPSGAPRRGTLLLPAHYTAGMRYPLIVYPYPLSLRSNNVNEFGVTGTGVENMQLLATRGFAVLAPDVPPFDMQNQMRDLAAIVLSGVDRVIQMGIADSSRLGVMGHSWGGYTVLALLVQTNRFKAAIMRGGYADKVGFLGVLEESGWARGLLDEEWQLGGTVWEQRQRYIDNSPIYFLDRVKTPLLIIHGEGETTVPILFADQVFASLQRLGKPVEYARYAGENHGEGIWSYPNQRDYLNRIIEWFDLYLGKPERSASR